jgi:hypothetical protein
MTVKTGESSHRSQERDLGIWSEPAMMVAATNGSHLDTTSKTGEGWSQKRRLVVTDGFDSFTEPNSEVERRPFKN